MFGEVWVSFRKVDGQSLESCRRQTSRHTCQGLSRLNEPLVMPVRDSLDVLANVGRFSAHLHCRQSHSLYPGLDTEERLSYILTFIHHSLLLDCRWKVDSWFRPLPP